MQLRPSQFTAQLLVPQTRRLVDINAFLGISQSALLSTDYQVLSGEIYNVLTTAIGEEEFEPEYGSLVPNRVFDPMDEETEQLLRTDIYLALKRWVPQVSVNLAETTLTGNRDERYWFFDLAIEIPDFGPDRVGIQFNLS